MSIKQLEIINYMKSTKGFIFNGVDGYHMMVGFNGGVVASLVKSGIIVKLNHKIYKGFYKLV